MPDIRVNIDPSTETTGLSQTDEAYDAGQATATEETPAQDAYVAGKVEEAPEFDPNFAQGAKRFAEDIGLPKRQRSRPDADKPELRDKEGDPADRTIAYPIPLGVSDGLDRCDAPRRGSSWGEMLSLPTPSPCEVEEMYDRMAIEVFKEANALDAQMKAAIKDYRGAKTPDEVRSARRKMYDVAERMRDFSEELHSRAVSRHPYTYSTQFNDMFTGIVNSMGELKRLLANKEE